MQKFPTPATKQVLVYADDDEDDLLLVQEAMAPYSSLLEVCLFTQCNEAYSFLLTLEHKAEKPCLVILDMNMPAMSGRELLPVLRSLPFFDAVPIVLFTTSSSQHDYRFALQYNAGFITKPMTIEQMDTIAQQFLEHCNREVREKLKKKY